MHSCGVTRNIRKGYAIASFHSFGSSHGAHCKAAEVQSAGHQFAPLCDENSSLRRHNRSRYGRRLLRSAGYVRFAPKADKRADVSLSPLYATSGREQT